MKNTVILKSYKDGIAIYLDDTLEFEQLCLDLAQKFRDSARFFGDMQVAVSFEGRTLTQEEENILVDTITSSSRLQVLCVIGKDAGLQNHFSNAAEAARYFTQKSASGDDGQFYRGSLKDGQILETEGSIVILGSVEEGCSIISTTPFSGSESVSCMRLNRSMRIMTSSWSMTASWPARMKNLLITDRTVRSTQSAGRPAIGSVRFAMLIGFIISSAPTVF